jgi:hypothetical protein
VFAAVGVTVTGLIKQMTSLWRQKVAADTLLVLCPVADERQLRTIISELLNLSVGEALNEAAVRLVTGN